MRKIFVKNACLCLFALSSLQANAQTKNTLPSWAIGPFVRPANVNPVIKPDSTSRFFCEMYDKSVDWESNDTFNPAAALKDGNIVVLYRAEDKSGVGIGGRTSRIGYAESSDGTTMNKKTAPVLYPAKDNQKEMEWRGGCEDPRVAMTEDGTYVMMYTQWNNKVPRLGVATSKDLVHWKKHGPAFKQAYNGKFFNEPTKSASICTKLKDGNLVVAKVNGKYWMYWGEKAVYAATSTDLTNWQPLIDGKGNLKKLMEPRAGYFDSDLTECGPPAIITDKGIVLMYNGKNAAGKKGDPNYTTNAYCAGQVLFSTSNPEKVVARLDKPFFIPEESFEKSGQYPAGTVFVEGLVYKNKQWFMYYGCADSRVGVAIAND
jgi:predicted GH43/DUF377 family glycosyl hydrolase